MTLPDWALGKPQEGSVAAIAPATTLTLKSAPTKVHTGDTVTKELVRKVADDVTAQIRDEVGDAYDSGRWKEARDIFEQVALADDFTTFLTLPAYDRLD